MLVAGGGGGRETRLTVFVIPGRAPSREPGIQKRVSYLDSRFVVIGPRFARTRWRRPGMTGLIPRLQLAEPLPGPAGKPHELHLLDRDVIGR
jgi:hypothetical protein